MTKERFAALLENPEMLASISFEELKTLALDYPYVHNFRYLLALKAKQDNLPEYPRLLAIASAYSLDRTRLYAIMAPKILAPVTTVQMEEDVLELLPLEQIKQEKTPVKLHRESEASAPAAAVSAEPEPSAPVEEILVPVQEKPVQVDVSEQWLPLFQLPVLRPVRARKEAPTPPEVPVQDAETPPSAQQLASKSVTENQELVTETMARIFAGQGYREKAIAMYEKLSLKYPEKSPIFAAEIEKIKKS